MREAMMERAKAAVRSVTNSLGFDLVRTRHSHQDLAGHLKNVFRQHRIDCVLDVGANTGQYGSFLRALGYRGKIVSFEPVASVFAQLQSVAASDPQWQCFNWALGDVAETKQINVYASTVFSSFLSTNDYSKSLWSSVNDATKEAVRVARLDQVFGEVCGGRAQNVFLKMDTQGFDLRVFEGARGVMSQVRAIQSELSFIPVYKDMPDGMDALAVYKREGFLVSGLYPINRDPGSLAVIEFDGVLVRSVP